jgi:hypothetical protein
MTTGWNDCGRLPKETRPHRVAKLVNETGAR